MANLIYRQKTGEIVDPEHMRVLGVCYSGRGVGLNNPSAENQRNVGPIPQGLYRIGAPESPVTHLGPLAFPLRPVAGNDARGRSSFFIHGDNPARDHTASDGCIVASHTLRQTVEWYVGDLLAVVSGLPGTPGAPAAPGAAT